jgi:oxygen-independent coproporphyrinogen-3 oxidase
MPGIYLHIPFCRKACTYCDFHFSTSLKQREAMIGAMHHELVQRAAEVQGTVETIYFGGGTPSLLDPKEIDTFLEQCRSLFHVAANAEVTLECNPDDVTPERLAEWKGLGITRLSLGTQSFREDRLLWMGRAHNAEQTLRSIDLIAKAGFASWTIDLIYGLPEMTLAEWDEQLAIALDRGMPHLSAYCLTVEPRTALAHQVGKRMVNMPGDDAQSAQFDRLMERMEQAELVHYEISNFGLPGHFSRHNTSYWQGVNYLGIGPSAHSFNGTERRWNVAHNARYITAIGADQPYWEQETLTPAQRTNELLLTGLRTIAGVRIDQLEMDALTQNRKAAEQHMQRGHLLVTDGRLVLSKAGRHFADRIAADLFVTDDRRDQP